MIAYFGDLGLDAEDIAAIREMWKGRGEVGDAATPADHAVGAT
jgi:hypothetical protein